MWGVYSFLLDTVYVYVCIYIYIYIYSYFRGQRFEQCNLSKSISNNKYMLINIEVLINIIILKVIAIISK